VREARRLRVEDCCCWRSGGFGRRTPRPARARHWQVPGGPGKPPPGYLHIKDQDRMDGEGKKSSRLIMAAGWRRRDMPGSAVDEDSDEFLFLTFEYAAAWV
jgi:hypothetical protein